MIKCESCNEQIASKMKAAIASNTCPFCSGNIMHPMKAEQYSHLLACLEQTAFTNKPEVDVQIREKVANLLVTKFVFKKLNEEASSDLIAIESEEEVMPAPQSSSPTFQPKTETKTEAKKQKKEKEKPLPEAPSRSLSGKKREVSPPSTKSAPPALASFYQGLEERPVTLDDMEDDPTEGLTEEEIRRFFPSLSGDDLAEIRGASTSQREFTGKGIKRV